MKTFACLLIFAGACLYSLEAQPSNIFVRLNDKELKIAITETLMVNSNAVEELIAQRLRKEL